MFKKLLDQSQRLLQRRESDILSAAAVITVAGMASSILGLVRNRILVGIFFKTAELRAQLDAYLVAFRLPELVFQLLVIGAISAAFIPVFSKYLYKNEREAYEISSTVLTLVTLVFLLASVIIYIWAEPLTASITAANFSREQIKLAASITRLMLLAQLFFALSSYLTGVIQAYRRFLIPALSPIIYNLGIIGGIIFLTPLLGIYGAALGVVIGALFHLMFQIPLARRLGFSYRLRWNLAHTGVKEMIKLMPPRTLTISVNQLEIFASVYLATALSAGSLTIFNLAQQLMSAPIRIFSVPIGQASLPFLAHETAQEKWEGFRKIFLLSLQHILYLALPASVLLLVLRVPLVRLAFGAKEFPWSATLLTGRVVAILAVSVLAQSVIHILTRAFYALHNTRIPLAVALVSVAANVLTAVVLVFGFNWGVIGLATAMSGAAILQSLLLSAFLWRRVGGFSWEELGKPVTKMMLATLIMGVASWVPLRLLDRFVFDTTRTVPLLLLTVTVGGIGAGVYLASSYLFDINELKVFLGWLIRLKSWRLKWGKTEEVMESASQTQEIKPV
ncbi:murein biosynthesis integral membrane protein MurJ [Microgenomates group bacterium RIFCSPHIGHO2_01_FULL_45_11]|nr:MAG: murein biosynthesis integral membrane protein MurJ [Microgenomates group bacterium RIFCSPHIGHO2_01_FULL_45_11]